MPQNHHFIQNLIEMREHYQVVVQKCDRASSHAGAQLNSLNALLADRLVENQHIESLLQLRAHYQTLYAQQQQQAQNAKEQIAHINALLADQLVLQHNEQQIAVQSTTIAQKQLNEGLTLITDEDDRSSLQQQDAQELPHPQIQTSVSTPEAQHLESDFIEPLDSKHQTTSAPPPQSRFLKTPLVPQYQHLTKSEAVEQLLQKNEGSILHVDYIIRALHGELNAEDLKAEKLRMNDTLRKGVEKGLWDKVPNSPGCYTINLTLVEQETKGTKTNPHQNQDEPLPKHISHNESEPSLLPRYHGMSFTGAVTTVIQEKAGEILTPEIVAKALYGDIAGKALTQAKGKVGKTLWNGAKQGRWQSVPGQLGMYTLPLNQLN
ncbi:hypothetical protein [Chroogloeocystis siderophila]|jgi:hypothetical protein|uniref:Uncharacterized protein n=1 Tax=Chroogloeocystis siderophila 5.2 s.c.1 TaxID=247279 RepID=A0A1U7HGL4_9CHRO|nr:hypothetical protein [Chroogloeocystis siderophila]OKH22691.1 hypothetical protein NIES1031_19775 [Chroogloeocystis siderophila 5.2 s.c.1]